MTTPEPMPAENQPTADKPKLGAANKPVPPKDFRTLGSVRDYFAVQLDQDASWQRYRPD